MYSSYYVLLHFHTYYIQCSKSPSAAWSNGTGHPQLDDQRRMSAFSPIGGGGWLSLDDIDIAPAWQKWIGIWDGIPLIIHTPLCNYLCCVLRMPLAICGVVPLESQSFTGAEAVGPPKRNGVGATRHIRIDLIWFEFFFPFSFFFFFIIRLLFSVVCLPYTVFIV